MSLLISACQKTTQQHSNTTTQQHNNTTTQQHNNTSTQQHNNRGGHASHKRRGDDGAPILVERTMMMEAALQRR
jgi:hypothetical protein